MQAAVVSFIQHHRFSERTQIYAAISLKMLGTSLFGIFVPIYLFKLGYSLQTILVFFALDYIMRLGWQWIAGWYVSRFGPKHALIVSAAATIIMLCLFYSLPQVHWPLLLLAALSGISNVFHFLGFYVDFADTQNVLESGKSVGAMAQFIILAMSLGPFIGGLINDNLGVGWALSASIVIVVVSLIPLLSTKDIPEGKPFRPHKLPWKEIKGGLASNFGRAWDIRASSIIWPFALYFIVHTYQNVGLIASLSFLGIIVTANLATRYVDRFGWPMLVSGTAVSAMVHLLRIMVTSLTGGIILNLVDGIVNWIAQIPWQSMAYRHARAVGVVEFFTVFNFTSDVGSVTFWLILLGVSMIASMQMVFTIAFLLGAIGVSLSLLIVQGKHRQPMPLVR